jgi:hypothetical protein
MIKGLHGRVGKIQQYPFAIDYICIFKQRLAKKRHRKWYSPRTQIRVLSAGGGCLDESAFFGWAV